MGSAMIGGIADHLDSRLGLQSRAKEFPKRRLRRGNYDARRTLESEC